MFGFQEMSDVIDEFANVSVAINGFESPAKPWKKTKSQSKPKEKKPIDWNKMLKKQKQRRGE